MKVQTRYLFYPVLLQAGYGKGQLYVLTIPENFSDLYSFPTGVLNQIRNVLLRDLYVRAETPGDVSLFVYDNGTFIVESFLPDTIDVRISMDPRFTKIKEVTTGEEFSGKPGGRRTVYSVQIKPHSYRVFSAVE